jgi:predicted branched-subunit amino acid permease
MSLVVFAGSAQLAALPLIATEAPMWVILATGFCVNLRFVIFSAQWRPYLMRFSLPRRLLLGFLATDMTYVLFMRRFPEPEPGPGQMPYFAGSAAVNWLAWQVPSIIGIVLADIIPTQWGLGFAGTMALLGMTYSLIFDKTTGVAAVVAGAAAVAAYALPFKLNIVVAIAAAVAAGLTMESAERARRMQATPP